MVLLPTHALTHRAFTYPRSYLPVLLLTRSLIHPRSYSPALSHHPCAETRTAPNRVPKPACAGDPGAEIRAIYHFCYQFTITFKAITFRAITRELSHLELSVGAISSKVIARGEVIAQSDSASDRRGYHFAI